MNTPWGNSNYQKTITRGVIEVQTPRHGGIAVAKGYAEKYLSESARNKAIYQSNYYFYEEDCDWAIPIWELKDLWDDYFNPMFDKNKEQYILETLSGWNADYLLEIGIEPLPEQYEHYLQTVAIWKRNIN